MEERECVSSVSLGERTLQIGISQHEGLKGGLCPSQRNEPVMGAEDTRTVQRACWTTQGPELFSDRIGKPVQGWEQLRGLVPPTSMSSKLRLVAGKKSGPVRVITSSSGPGPGAPWHSL